MNTIIKLIYDNAIGSLMDGFTEKIPIQLIKWSLKAIPHAGEVCNLYLSLPYAKQEKIFNDIIKKESVKENINEDDYRNLILDYNNSEVIFDPRRKNIKRKFLRSLHLTLSKDNDMKNRYFVDTLDEQSRKIKDIYDNYGVLKDFFQQIQPNINWEKNRLGKYGMKPSLIDLAENRIAIPGYLVDELSDLFYTNDFIIITGGRECGKTWLTYIFGYYSITNNNNNEFYYVQADDNFDAFHVLNELEEKMITNGGNNVTYLVVEDCHLAPEQCAVLLSILLKQREPGLKVIFTSRNKSILDEFKDDGIYRLNINKNSLFRGHAKNIIKKFIKVKNINYDASEEELDEVIKKFGTNLYILWLKLRYSWRYEEGQRLLDIDESRYDNHIYDYIWREGEIKLKDRIEPFLYLSTLCQFELLPVYELALDGYKETLDELITDGIVELSHHSEKDYINIDQELSELILETLSKKDSFYNEDQLLRSQIDIIVDYIKSKSTPPNWYSIFTRLYDSRNSNKSKLVKEALKSLWSDDSVFNMVKSNINDIDLIKVGIILSSILWVEDDKNNRRWWEVGKLIEIRNLRKVSDEDLVLIRERSTSSRYIRKIMPYLKFFNFYATFGKFSHEDFGKILETSSINAIRWLTNDFKKYYNQPKFVVTIARSLMTSDLSRIIQNDVSCLYKLNGLIGNIRQVDPATAAAFIERLSDVDFNSVFLNARYEELDNKNNEIKIKTTGRVVNLFLSDYAASVPAARKKIVDNISDDTWLNIIKDESDLEKLYLLWNLYLNNPITTKRLVEVGIGKFLSEPLDIDLMNELSLPLMGIYKLCDIQIVDINFGPHIQEFRGRIDKYIYADNMHPPITLIILSALALKSNLKHSDFGIFKDSLIYICNEKMNGYVFGGDTTREELTIRLLDHLIYDKPINNYNHPDYEIYND
jgi:hypothetical protein